MAAVAFPTVIAAVMTVADAALPAARVVRGRDFSGDPDDVVLVGVASIDDASWDDVGSFDQEFQTFGGARTETGTVNGVAFSRSGSGDQQAATTAASDLVAGLGAAIKSAPSLGVTTFDYVVAQFQSGAIQESQNNEGAVTAISFVVEYQARIT